MKFVLTYTMRPGGSAADRRQAAVDGLKLLESWQPSESGDIKEWLTRVDGNGGFAVVEGDDPGEMLKDLSVWNSFFEYSLYPVLDIGDAVPKQQEALAVLAQLD